jgi:hypothetical protein
MKNRFDIEIKYVPRYNRIWKEGWKRRLKKLLAVCSHEKSQHETYFEITKKWYIFMAATKVHAHGR